MAVLYKADSIIPQTAGTPDIETGPDESDVKADKHNISAEDEPTEVEAKPRNYGDNKPATLNAQGWTLAHLTFQALGVVYGDIGTSPLYVLNGIFVSPLGREEG